MALIQAIRNGDLQRVQELLISGEADANEKDARGNSALYNAIDYNHGTETPTSLEIFKTLVKHRADVNGKYDDWTVLKNVSANCHHIYYVDFIKELVEAGADVNFVKDEFDLNALQCVFLSGYVEREFAAVQILIEHGADVNRKYRDGSTVLHKACNNGNYKAAQAFIRLGLNVNEKDANGNTSLHMAVKGLLKHLEHCEDEDTIRYKEYYDKTIKELLRNGADYTIKNNEGNYGLSGFPQSGNINNLLEKYSTPENKEPSEADTHSASNVE